MNRKALIIVLAVVFSLLAGCSSEPEPEPEPTVVPSPEVSDLFKSQSLKFVEEASKLKSMTEQGINFVEYSEQLSEVAGVYELLDSLWIEGFEIDTKENIEKALEGWRCANLLWDLKINHKYAVDNQGVTKDAFYRVYEYAGDNLDINIHKDTFVDELTGEEIHNMVIPYDTNIPILFSLASDYFDDAKPVLLQIIQ